MTKKLHLEVTSRLYRKILEAEDSRKFVVAREQLLKDVEQAEEQLKEVDSMEKFNIISKEIKDLQMKIKELEIKVRIQPRVAEEVSRTEGAKIKDIYNKEFEPHYKEYLKLKNEMEKKLVKFAKEIEPVVNRMIEIEDLEQSFHMMKNKKHIADRGEFIELPVERKTLKNFYSPFNGIHHNSSSSVKEVVTAIKGNWGER